MKLVTGYKDPDTDGLACAVAYSEFLNQTGVAAKPAVFGKLHEESEFLIKKYALKMPEMGTYQKEDEIILVDASDLNGLDKSVQPNKVIEVIDHRKINDVHLFPEAKVQIELVGAAATLIAEKFAGEKLTPSIAAATLLYGAIISNTLNFQAKVTTQRDCQAAEWLNKKLNLPDYFAHEMFAAKSDFSGDRLIRAIEHDTASFKRGRHALSINQLEMLEADQLVKTRDCEIVALLRELKKTNRLDLIMLSIIDLEAGCNFFLSPDEQLKKLLSKIFKVKFEGDIAKRDGLIMRKEIVPLLLPELEKII